ncbi:hypothetical protein [Trichormus variabilis]|nr:hypothetical protein [Trichormus variabilis]
MRSTIHNIRNAIPAERFAIANLTASIAPPQPTTPEEYRSNEPRSRSVP